METAKEYNKRRGIMLLKGLKNKQGKNLALVDPRKFFIVAVEWENKLTGYKKYSTSIKFDLPLQNKVGVKFEQSGKYILSAIETRVSWKGIYAESILKTYASINSRIELLYYLFKLKKYE